MASVNEMKKTIRRYFEYQEGEVGLVALYTVLLKEKGFTYKLFLLPNGDIGKVKFQDNRIKLPKYKNGEKIGKITGMHVLCPFCQFPSSCSNPFQWCSGCYVEYYKDEAGQFVFDPKLRREEYLWFIAIAKAGGVRIGGDLPFEKQQKKEGNNG